MAWNEAAFGKILHREFCRFKYSRIPNLFREYFITTKGLVIRGGEKGTGDLLSWDRIKEPGTSDGLQFLGLDIAGTVRFNTPITLTVMGRNGKTMIQEFPQMSRDFYLKLLSAWQVSQMFRDDEKYREKALLKWSKHKDSKKGRNKEQYLEEICQDAINSLFRTEPEMKKKAKEMLEKGELNANDLRGNAYQIRKKVKQYTTKSKTPIGFVANESQSGNTTKNNGLSGNAKSRQWGNVQPHERYTVTGDTGRTFRNSLRTPNTPKDQKTKGDSSGGRWGNTKPHKKYGR